MKMMVTGMLIAVAMMGVGAAFAAGEETAQNKPEVIQLWPAEAPIGNGQSEKSSAKITVYRPEKPNGTAVVICPGGGYSGLVTDPEGFGIARWLNGHNITGVVLEYRLPAGRPMVPLLDAQQAIRITRANARAWRLNPKRIGIIGFSAGGHVASTAGTHFSSDYRMPNDRISTQNCRPDFMILIYPVVTMGAKTHGGSRENLLGADPTPELVKMFSNEEQVTDRTPPTFLAHAADDTVVSPDNSKDFYLALKAHKVTCEYLVLPNGGHGLNGYQGPSWDEWQAKSLEWLKAMKLSR